MSDIKLFRLCAGSQQGHWGTGDVELSLTSQADLDTAKPLVLMSYLGRSTATQGRSVV